MEKTKINGDLWWTCGGFQSQGVPPNHPVVMVLGIPHFKETSIAEHL